jgi:hypothetical protein
VSEQEATVALDILEEVLTLVEKEYEDAAAMEPSSIEV